MSSQRFEDGLAGGLYDYRARWYDPYLNRWVQPDTVIPDPGDPQSLNRYSYSSNNPIRYSDPTGFFSEEQIMDYLDVDSWEAVLAMFEERGIYEDEWGWLEVLHSAEFGDNVYFVGASGNLDYATFTGTFIDFNGQMMFINQEGDPENVTSLMSVLEYEGYTVTRPGSYCNGVSCERSVAQYLDRNRQYYHLRIHPGNLHTDPISVWHYAELLGIGTANYALGALMITSGAALCTTVVGCIAAGMAIAPGLGAIGTGAAFHYGLIVELEHQHVIEWGP